MCVFSVSKRRRSWILGQVVSLWAGVLCNHTHKHSEDSPRGSGRGCTGGACLLTSTHTHTFFSHCLLNPTPCQALTLRLGRRGLWIIHFSISRLGTWGPQFAVPHHTAGPVLLYQEVSSLSYSHIPARNLLLNQNQPTLTTVVVHPEHTWHDSAQRPPPAMAQCSSCPRVQNSSPLQPNLWSLNDSVLHECP